MPALRYMGRRWGIGADELALPSLCSMTLRVVWTVALVIILVRGFDDATKNNVTWLCRCDLSLSSCEVCHRGHWARGFGTLTTVFALSAC